MEEEMTTTEVETTGENIKTYSQEEVDGMKAKWESGYQKRLDKAIKRKMRDVEEENFKKDQLIDALRKGVQKEDATLDDLLDISEQQYKITIPRTRENKEDNKVLGKHDAEEILEENDEEIVKSEIDRLANRTRTEREDETLNELKSFLEEQNASKQKQEQIEKLKEIGLDETILENEDFKAFQDKFSQDTSLTEIAEMYNKLNGTPEEESKPFNPGSAKDIKTSGGDEFFTLDEFMALTEKDLDNPKIYEKAMKSLTNFYKK